MQSHPDSGGIERLTRAEEVGEVAADEVGEATKVEVEEEEEDDEDLRCAYWRRFKRCRA